MNLKSQVCCFSWIIARSSNEIGLFPPDELSDRNIKNGISRGLQHEDMKNST